MIQRKIDQLGEADCRLLVAAAAQGQEFDSAVVSRGLAADAAEVEERLEILDRIHGFVRRVREWEFPNRTLTLQYRFVHVLYQNVLYSSLTPTRRASLSAAVAQALLDFYGKHSATIASELAFLFEAARDFARASHYYLAAAQNAARVFANQEATTLACRGLDSLKGLPESTELCQQELRLLLTLGGPLMATKGYGAPEVQQTWDRARELCQQMGEPRELFSVLAGLFPFYCIRAAHQKAAEVAEQLMRLAQHQPESGPLLLAHHALGAVFSFKGELAPSCEHFDQAIKLYDRRQHSSYALLYALDIGVNCWSHRARSLWLLGYPDQALDSMNKALDLAQELSHPFSLGSALMLAAQLHQLRREAGTVLERADASIAFGVEHGLPQLLSWASVWRGWAIAKCGRRQDGIAQIRENLAIQRAMGSEIIRPHALGVLAEELGEAGNVADGLTAIDEAMRTVECTGEGYYEAELHRRRGELLLRSAADAQAAGAQAASTSPGPEVGNLQSEGDAEKSFRQAIDIARRQQAKSFELRAAMSLARLYGKQSKKKEACRILKDAYDWFTEGFDTPDLLEAKALLEEMS
jgi:predicted ATPase